MRRIIISAVLLILFLAIVYILGRKFLVEREILEEAPVCIQVITPAIGPEGQCKEFPTPCDVPAGWTKIDQCP